MFTGIIETVGTIKDIREEGDNLELTVVSSISQELKPDQSVSHNGACLTVTAVENGAHRVVAIRETLQKTQLGNLRPGDQVNLERSLTLQQRLDGHLVQGHVDARGVCMSREEKNGSREFRIHFPPAYSHLVIEKGSVALNGISLTVFHVTRDAFSVAVIPYTYDHTTMRLLQPGDAVNLEFDLIGKYVARLNAEEREKE